MPHPSSQSSNLSTEHTSKSSRVHEEGFRLNGIELPIATEVITPFRISVTQDAIDDLKGPTYLEMFLTHSWKSSSHAS